jgi:hypothetical protein
VAGAAVSAFRLPIHLLVCNLARNIRAHLRMGFFVVCAQHVREPGILRSLTITLMGEGEGDLAAGVPF